MVFPPAQEEGALLKYSPDLKGIPPVPRLPAQPVKAGGRRPPHISARQRPSES